MAPTYTSSNLTRQLDRGKHIAHLSSIEELYFGVNWVTKLGVYIIRLDVGVYVDYSTGFKVFPFHSLLRRFPKKWNTELQVLYINHA